MTKHADFLVEILTEELPPKILKKIADEFSHQITSRLEKTGLSFDNVTLYATPRRLALLVNNLAPAQPDQRVEKRGPALTAAYDKDGKPTPACQGFAKSCGTTPASLTTIKTEQGEWVGFQQNITGKRAVELLPDVINETLAQLPLPKRMRWSDKSEQFIRPVHSVVLLYGNELIKASIMGCQTTNKTVGHRFMAPDVITIEKPSDYAAQLKMSHVLADFAERRQKIQDDALAVVASKTKSAKPVLEKVLLDEVTGLVEWPVVMLGHFDDKFLKLPKEVLVSAMQDHQRYFPVEDEQGKLEPYFVLTSNIESKDAARVVHGNERVLRARLSDAAFFYEKDQSQSLESRIDGLKAIVFQAKLGTLHEKAVRLSALSAVIAAQIGGDKKHAQRAGLLAKADLLTDMVGEFPELQGVMGSYYAAHDGEAIDVVTALKEQYLPRFAGDGLPHSKAGQALALADRIDLLTGAFGIGQIPTGDKDPYGLRRAALGVSRILIENNLNLNLRETFAKAAELYQVALTNEHAQDEVIRFTLDRLRAWYQDQGVSADVFASVAALNIADPLDIDRRIKAVQSFKQLAEAEALSVANKRVSNILTKQVSELVNGSVDVALFESNVESELAAAVNAKRQQVSSLSAARDYEGVLQELAGLRQPVDDFFDQVMVMTDDVPRRENRLRLLSQLRALFLHVADIALLQ